MLEFTSFEGLRHKGVTDLVPQGNLAPTKAGQLWAHFHEPKAVFSEIKKIDEKTGLEVKGYFVI